MSGAVRAAPDEAALVGAALEGSVRAVARLLSHIELGGATAAAVSAAVHDRPRSAAVLGITGPPGVGKSTTTARLVGHYRQAGLRVAVLAVDPSSPFSGGALLGDRVRMGAFTTDPGVYIRSMSSRGHLGGLSAAAPGAVDLLSAVGFDVILVETVGVGQNEVDVMRLADSVLVVLAPGMGDGIQAAKAGILEIADILVVNKADREGTAVTIKELKSMIALGRSGSAEPGEWRIPVLSLIAADGTGLAELDEAIQDHRAHLAESGEGDERRRRRAGEAVQAAVLERLEGMLSSVEGRTRMAAAASAVADGTVDHHRASRELLQWLGSVLTGE